MNEKPTVYIIDDVAAARESLAALVRSMGVAFECFASAEKFLASYEPNRLGCIVTDVRMGGMSGLEMQERLVEMESALPIIVVSAYASVSVAVKSIQNGAIMYLEKTCTEHELWKAINDALRENVAQLKTKLERDAIRKDLATLTDSERKVFDLIGEGKANKQIAHALNIGLRTVESHRSRVMQKLEVESLSELVRFFIKTKQLVETSSPLKKCFDSETEFF